MNKLDIHQIKAFLLEDIWRVTDDEVSRKRGMIYNAIKILTLSIKEFTERRIVNKASALTYNTLLAIIPILAILFAIARGFGFANLLEDQFRSGLEGQALTAETVLSFIDSYLSHAKSGIFIGVGLIMLFYTVLLLTYNMERTFNSIWQVKKPRSLYRKMTDYFSMLLLLPLLILLSSGISIFMSTFLKNIEEFALLAPIVKFLVRLTPFVLTWGMFTALYIFMPNTKVKIKYAILPGILAGSAFQAFQYLYIGSQIWVSRYNAIYGSFAAIPMFLLWTQISWSICLFGATLCYANQNVKEYSSAHSVRDISRRYRDFLTLLIMSKVCKRFEKGMTPYTPQGLATECNIPISLVNDIIYELRTVDLLRETHDIDEEVIGFIPGQDISKITVNLVMQRIDKNGNERFANRPIGTIKNWEQIQKLRSQYLSSNDDLPLKDL